MYYKNQKKQFKMTAVEVCSIVFVVGFIIVLALSYFSGNDPADVLPYYFIGKIIHWVHLLASSVR